MPAPASLKIFLGLLLSLAAGVMGLGCFLFSGIGICGSSFSAPVFSVIFAGAVASAGFGGALVPKAWYFPAFAFNATSALGLLVTVLSLDWLRTTVILFSVVSAYAAGYVGSRPAEIRRRWMHELSGSLQGKFPEK